MMEKAETKSTEVEAHDDTPEDGYHVQERPHDDGGDDEEHFSDAEEVCSLDDEDKAETPLTVQTEHVHEAVAEQEDADQDDSNDHVAAASRDRGDGAAKFPDEGIQKRPKKPPDAGCLKLKRVGPGLLKIGILLMHLFLLLLIISGPVQMNTYVGDDELHTSENESV